MDTIGKVEKSEGGPVDDGFKESRLKLETLYRISNAVNTTFNLDELYLSLHQALGEAIDIDYFYIALYDEQTDILSFPYNTDTLDGRGFGKIKNVSNSTSFTWEVVKTGQPLKLTKKEQFRLSKRLGGDMIGTPSELWIGAPLVVRKKGMGAIVAQSYTNPEQYSEKDTELFISISDQIVMGIERKVAEVFSGTLHNVGNL